MAIDTSYVVSTRIRLARNVKDFHFPAIIRGSEAERVLVNKICALFSRFGNYNIYTINSMSEDYKQFLLERYLISNNLANNPYGAVCINDGSDVSIMVSEEDHIREQCFSKGFDLIGAYKKIVQVDNILARHIRFCKSGDCFLTACPSNIGSGMRASVMMFLPALCHTDEIERLINLAKSKNITFRGAFGEGSQSEGYWFQVSNSVTLLKDSEILNNVNEFVKLLIELEEDTRNELFSLYKEQIMDKCFRAYGILQNCYVLSYEECINLIACVKLGNSLGFINLNNPTALDDLVISVRPYTLKYNLKINGEINEVDFNEDVLRAKWVREYIKRI